MTIQTAYNNWSDSYDTDLNLTRDLESRVTREGISHRIFDSILEVGCGTGKNTTLLAQIGREVHALDFSEGMLAKAREKIGAANVRFERADLTHRWPCADEAYDLILCSLVLEHISNLTHIFSEARRVLKPDGRFFVNELHPFRQHLGSQARFEQNGQTIKVDAFIHNFTDFFHTAESVGMRMIVLNEYWHEQDQGKPPRLVSFMFMT